MYRMGTGSTMNDHHYNHHGARDACASQAPVYFLFLITNDMYRTGTGTGSTINGHHYHHHGA